MQGVATPTLLMKEGDNPHHYTLRPADAQSLMHADMIILTNRSYEFYLQPLLETLPERKHTVVEALATPALTLLPATEKLYHPNTLDGGYVDMHFWLNPNNAIAYTYYIEEKLSELDPQHSNLYARNAKEQIARIRTLDKAIRDLLGKPPIKASYATYHPSLAYFENYYSISGGKTITRTPESGASVAEAETLHQAITQGQLRCLFDESTFHAKLVKQLASDNPDTTRLITLDPLGVTYHQDVLAYDNMMMAIATAIHQCSDSAGDAND